jgi:hypothetical protein
LAEPFRIYGTTKTKRREFKYMKDEMPKLMSRVQVAVSHTFSKFEDLASLIECAYVKANAFTADRKQEIRDTNY